MDWYEHLRESVFYLNRVLDPAEFSRLSVRPGYDESPEQIDLQYLTDEAVESLSEPSYKLGDVVDFLDDNFDEETYVDWTDDGNWHQDLEKEWELDYEYRLGGRLVIEVYEEGDTLEGDPRPYVD